MNFYTYQHLSQFIGQKLQLLDDVGTQVSLTLDRLEKGKLNPTQWEAFAAYFIGEPDFHIPQGTYQLSHPQLGVATLFLSPKSEIEYELVISRQLTRNDSVDSLA